MTSPSPVVAVLCLLSVGLAGCLVALWRENRRLTDLLAELSREGVRTNTLLLERLR